MRVLSLVHHENTKSGVFGEAVREAGHELVQWDVSVNPRPPGDFGALLVFGGAMDVHQEEEHPWLREEAAFVRRALEAEKPVFGLCLGGQILANALHAQVSRAPEPEIGWSAVELMAQAAGDPIFGGFPERFDAYQWHSYQFALPAGAIALARSPVCLQAYRYGDAAWGVQFHPEVTEEIVASWSDAYATDPDAVRAGFDPEAAKKEARRQIRRWNELGREMCRRFLALAERRA